MIQPNNWNGAHGGHSNQSPRKFEPLSDLRALNSRKMLTWSPRIAPNQVRKNALKSLSPALFIGRAPAQEAEITLFLHENLKIVSFCENGWCPCQGLNRVTASLHLCVGENPQRRGEIKAIEIGNKQADISFFMKYYNCNANSWNVSGFHAKILWCSDFARTGRFSWRWAIRSDFQGL